jgi:acetyltransferase-like isoleucine patch superfamily enzyme
MHESRRYGNLKPPYSNVRIADTVQVAGWKPSLLSLEEGVSLGHGTILAFGDETNGFGHISIGEKTWLGEYNNLRSGGGNITIGSNCLISQFVSLVASGHGTSRHSQIASQSPPEKRHIEIRDDVWIGAGATILPGIVVDTGAVIGAGAVVTSNVKPYSIVAGVPARQIGERA